MHAPRLSPPRHSTGHNFLSRFSSFHFPPRSVGKWQDIFNRAEYFNPANDLDPAVIIHRITDAILSIFFKDSRLRIRSRAKIILERVIFHIVYRSGLEKPGEGLRSIKITRARHFDDLINHISPLSLSLSLSRSFSALRIDFNIILGSRQK